MTEPATLVSCLTPAGTGAIAVVALYGAGAWPAVRDLFHPASKKPLPENLPEAGTVWFGHFGADGLRDEVVVTVKQSAPQPWLEIHCHGGRQVVEWLVELLSHREVQRLAWPDFLRLIESAIRAEALATMANAETVRTAAILLDQANGAMDRLFEEIRLSLERGDSATAVARIDAVLNHAKLGAHLTEPWKVVVAGAPNVGKSSLMNAVAGYQRSVVAPVPGTTRDVVTARLAIDGWPVVLSDTAGLGDTAAGLEREGVDLARSMLESADLILWVLDSTVPPVWPDAATVARNPLLVVNKIDQPAAWDVSAVAGARHVSALTGAGVAGLCDAISRFLVASPPAPGDAVPFEPSQLLEIDKLRSALMAHNREASSVLESGSAGANPHRAGNI